MPHALPVRRAALLSSGPPISLKVLYCLQALGIPTDVIDVGSSTSMARFSRYRSRYLRITGAQKGQAASTDDVERALRHHVEAHGVDAIIAGDIEATALLHAVRSRFADRLCFPTSDGETLELLDDKWRFQQFMEAHGLPCPRSVLLESADDAEAAVAALRYPVVAKPLHGESSHGVVKLADAAALAAHLGSGSKYARPPLLVQEYAPGQDADISFLAHEGEIVSHVLHSRRDGCVLSFMRNDAVLDIARRIARASRYSGVANVDVRIDGERVTVLECNPRFWYTLQASLWRGVNFVEAGLAVAAGTAWAHAVPADGSYTLHGCLVRRLVRQPLFWRLVPAYNRHGLFQALSDPMPFIAGRFAA